MLIIIEGVDASGKSTLASALSDALGMSIVPSEGPPRHPGEINERLARYAQYDNVIFDRHPVISQPIYGQLRQPAERINSLFECQLYDVQPIFIYCEVSGNNKQLDFFDRHTRKTYDTDDHMQQVDHNYHLLLASYRSWAMHHALLWYRIGDDVPRIIQAVRGIIK